VSTAQVSVGDAAPAGVTIQAIDGLSCMVERPRCGLGDTPPGQFRIGGMTPTDGFEAVLGIGLRYNSFGNPLAATASGQWIVILPRPGESGPGKLILNPSAEDKAGFTLFQLRLAGEADASNIGWLDEELTACLISEASNLQWCGDAVLDTGAPNIYLHVEGQPPAWRFGEPMRVDLGLGERKLSFRYRMKQGPGADLFRTGLVGDDAEKVNLGILPYYYYAIYYDARAGMIGLKARPPMAEAPTLPLPPVAAPTPPSRGNTPKPRPPAAKGGHSIDGCVNAVQRNGNHCPTGGN
jgi:hypothetical protein